MKKTIVIIAGPSKVIQALWYYSVYPEDEYIALVKAFGPNTELQKQLVKICQKSGIFKQVKEVKMLTLESELVDKIKMMFQMCLYYILGKKSKLTKKIILEQLGTFDFDKALVDCEASILGGAFIDWAKKKEVVILEDGLLEIEGRKKYPGLSLQKIYGWILSKMGYVNPLFCYPLKNTRYCEKYCSIPELVKYKGYRSIRKLYDKKRGDYSLYQKTLKKAFDVSTYYPLIQNIDVVIFSATFSEYTESMEYCEQLYKWLKDNKAGCKILIKRHPRDIVNYEWNDLDITILEGHIPGEVLIEQLKDKEIVLMFVSTIVLSIMNRDMNFSILKFSSIQNLRYIDVTDRLTKELNIEDRIINI